ncbi:alpha-amylase family glycosyl hydrolase [Undibacterium sp. TJN19]|uniref:alpha-amylase family glycosyl hydrolase n=1 Tax=Undibacterium sp. TJN19 TaxID=3413055 RepID=UPI003BF27E79
MRNMRLAAQAIALAVALAAGSIPASFAQSAQTTKNRTAAVQPFLWENATVYFLLTDRFYNADPGNDLAYGRQRDAAPLRAYMGGDLAGITAKIRAGYFRDLGVDVIWLTPPVEQIHAGTDEGTGKSYGFHGYWARDFSSVDANLGTEADMREFVDTAHAHGIRVLLDVVMNHLGPVTPQDPVWPDAWVRTSPTCTYKDTETTVSCTLVDNLPDIRTDSTADVVLPPALVDKWKAEGRYEREVNELDDFFTHTGWPRAPRYYLMKWHTDWVRKYGVDGFRADTAKHTEPEVWKELRTVASAAYEEWKRNNPAKKLGDQAFFMTGEVYNYALAHGLLFDMGAGRSVNFYQNGFDSLINFGFKSDAKRSYEALFSDYSTRLHGSLEGYSVLNYISSHDDGGPFDLQRQKPFEAANKLLLSPGAAQIYYGDETARVLNAADAQGDAALRSPMNWDELAGNMERQGYRIADVRQHWSRLGLFRRAHPAIGAGLHEKLADQPYTFKRTYNKDGISDKVVIALDLPATGKTAITVSGVFADGQKLRDAYSGTTAIVHNGQVQFDSSLSVALIAADESALAKIKAKAKK